MNERQIITKTFKTPVFLTSSVDFFKVIAPFIHVLYKNRPSCYALISDENIAGSTIRIVNEQDINHYCHKPPTTHSKHVIGL